MAAHALGPKARSAQSLAVRHRDRGHRPRARARVARWNGQTLGRNAFSVAQHSLVVRRNLPQARAGWSKENRLLALLHDAPEYVIGDMISPFKAALGLDYKASKANSKPPSISASGLPAHPPQTGQSHHQARRPDLRLFRSGANSRDSRSAKRRAFSARPSAGSNSI